MSDNEEGLSLGQFIRDVKHDLVSTQTEEDDPVPFFVIDEVIIEINFFVEGTIKGGFNLLKVVEVGSEVAEHRIQKATVHLKPILTREEIIKRTEEKDSTLMERITSEGRRYLLRGQPSDTQDAQDDTPPR
ncbi:MAG: trypco2 family protein [Chloroflexota bacterium]